MARDRVIRPRPGTGVIPVGKGAVATVDITDGPSVELTKDGYRAVRVAKVSNLKGSGAARLFWAINAQGVPKYGEFHPVISNLPVGRIHAALASEGTTDIAIVTCEYFFPTGGNLHFANVDGIRESTLPQLEIVSTVQPAQTQNAYWAAPPQTEEAWGPMWLKYRELGGPDEGPHPGPDGIPYQYQGGDVQYQIPMMVFRFSRREPSDAYVGDRARNFVGTLNNEPVFGDPVRTWLCTRIDGVSDDGGITYNVTYEFQYNPETWDPVIVFTNPETGKPVANPVWGESIRRVRVYRLADFFELGLTI